MEDKLIKCEHCGSDMCYATPINEIAWSYSCTGCGFTANDILKEGEFDMEQFEEIFPELYKDLKYVDDKKRIWGRHAEALPVLFLLFQYSEQNSIS